VINVRQTIADDLPGILAITNAEIEHGYAHFGTEPLELEDVARDFAAAAGRYPWVTGEAAGGVVGFARAYPWKPRGGYAWSAEIGVYVLASHRGRGAGRALYAELFPRLRGAGLRCVLAGISLPNAASVRLHESFGMKRVGTLTRVGFKLGVWRDVGYWQLVWGEAHEPPGKPAGFLV